MAKKLGFTPDYAVPPGRILEKILAAKGMSKTEFAERCGHSAKMVSEIIAGKAPILARTAYEFERVLGRPAAYWINLQALYDTRRGEQEERQRLEAAGAWADKFPVTKMVKLGIFPKPVDAVDKVRKLLDFFGTGSVEAWGSMFEAQEGQYAFRRSQKLKSEPFAVAAWLRWGERLAESIECAPFNASRFRDTLGQARAMTRIPPEKIQERLVPLCASAGVAVVFVPELPKTCASGATKWVGKEKAVILLSLRHKSDDHLWFTFFHEAAHILLHGKKDVFIDENGLEADAKEQEANQFATSTLVPRSAWTRFVGGGHFSERAIRAFADEIGIAPGIVVGQLQFNGLIPYSSRLNHLKVRFAWAESEGQAE
ncbi:ImmA/IrrE family metallo-endopeptidase [Rhodocista pekingensis]|uniref:ImmA/IrrE family metallo-endopeptidase n=1 Tax=Rhodocista pekingensis TaxID=201185 RepID=A0ABW2KXW3_9PROT